MSDSEENTSGKVEVMNTPIWTPEQVLLEAHAALSEEEVESCAFVYKTASNTYRSIISSHKNSGELMIMAHVLSSRAADGLIR